MKEFLLGFCSQVEKKRKHLRTQMEDVKLQDTTPVNGNGDQDEVNKDDTTSMDIPRRYFNRSQLDYNKLTALFGRNENVVSFSSYYENGHEVLVVGCVLDSDTMKKNCPKLAYPWVQLHLIDENDGAVEQ